MPRVWDLSVEEAKQALRGAGLVFTIHYAQSTQVPEGGLLGASPPDRTELDEEAEIALTVSSGPPRNRG